MAMELSIGRDRVLPIQELCITINGMRKMQGHEVPEEQVDAWVAEAEAGYDVEQLRKRGRPTRGERAAQVVPVRFTDEEISSLMKRAEREHLNRSEAIRRAVREWTTA
ncbi:ribbon-helix-helix protein, CopG family [Brachybacterium tyrofermentans]|uniref:ribbon-helix-helix protein, CopG family n=1 Tax=Brachybacterium tyrofermentans TaxID=47848 RepID=UPI003FD28C3A